MISKKPLAFYLTKTQLNSIKENFNLQVLDIIPPGPNQENPKLFIAKDLKTNQEVIVKNIRNLQNGFREVVIMKRFLGVDHIVQIINTVSDADYELIIMQKGECDLHQYITKCKIISDENLIQITSNILQGLTSMHEQKEGYWHRDLKPPNIFVFFKNKNDLSKSEKQKILYLGKQKVHAKIGDLGSAKQYIRGTELTKGIGTQPFKCPEIQNQQTTYNNKIDVWSLGLTLFELYTKTSYSEYYLKGTLLCRNQAGCKTIREYLCSIIDSKCENKFKSIMKDIIKYCIQFNPEQRQPIKNILSKFKIFLDSLKIKVPDIILVQENLSEIHRQELQNMKGYKRNHENFLKTLDIASKKVVHFLKLIQTRQKQQSLKPNKNDITMIKAIKKNLLWEKYQYEQVIQKYKKNVQLEDNLIVNIRNNKKEIEIRELKIELQRNITAGNNVLNEKRKRAMKNVDICFMIDGTGSMSSVIKQVKENILKIIKLLITQNTFFKLRFSFVIYRDFDQKDQSFEIFPFVDSIQPTFLADVEKFLGNVKATGGADQAQDINGALQRVMKLDWDCYSKAIFHYTDAPCHQKKYNGLSSSDSYLNKMPESDIQYSKIFKEFKTVGIHYFILQVEKCEAIRFMHQAFKKQYDAEKPYRSRINTLGTINLIDYQQIKQAKFSQIILSMGTQINLVTTSSNKVKRRVPKSEAEYLSQKPFDLEDEPREFLG